MLESAENHQKSDLYVQNCADVWFGLNLLSVKTSILAKLDLQNVKNDNLDNIARLKFTNPPIFDFQNWPKFAILNRPI